ncbi:MAG: hypothetical protein HYZ75_09610 [Elusimicrobia bacterium]|nr:hypothetical protein [Elusimicrobiota bacterium]
MTSWLLGLLLLAAPARAQFLAPVLPPGRVLAAVPPWIAMEKPGLEEARDKLLRALELLRRSPSGRALLGELGVGRVLIEENGSLYVTDGTKTVFAGANFVDEYPEDVLAVQMAHELEHVRQIRLGVTGSGNLALRELAAVLVQTRVWVELGGTIHDEHWKGNRGNSWDMTAALDHPYTALAAIAARAGHQLAFNTKAGRRYWEDVLASDARWRGQWRERFPRGRDSREAAMLALRQAASFMDPRPEGEITGALPAAIEAAAAGRPLPKGTELSPLEREILSRLVAR